MGCINDRLMTACNDGDSIKVRHLLKRRMANPNYVCRCGDNCTPLIVASGVSLKCVEVLIQHGALINTENRKGHSPLTVACFQGGPGIVEFLLQKGADPNYRNKHDFTALNSTCAFGNLNEFEMLFKYGAKLEFNINKEIAKKNGHFLIVELLFRQLVGKQIVLLLVWRKKCTRALPLELIPLIAHTLL